MKYSDNAHSIGWQWYGCTKWSKGYWRWMGSKQCRHNRVDESAKWVSASCKIQEIYILKDYEGCSLFDLPPPTIITLLCQKHICVPPASSFTLSWSLKIRREKRGDFNGPVLEAIRYRTVASSSSQQQWSPVRSEWPGGSRSAVRTDEEMQPCDSWSEGRKQQSRGCVPPSQYVQVLDYIRLHLLLGC